jgi:phosphoribosylanthranilate isomerase
MVLIKICGVTRAAELRACAELGVDAVGLNFWSGSKRRVGEREAGDLVSAWPESGLQRVGVFVDDPPDRVAALCAGLGLDAAQLHGDRHPDDYEAIEVPLVWVVRGTPSLDALRRRRPRRPPAWVLLDAAVPGYGGEGVATDWGWAAQARAALDPWPVWLAGGLKPENAGSAIQRVRPAGLDVASGAERGPAPPGEPPHKDPEAIAALVSICHNPERERD